MAVLAARSATFEGKAELLAAILETDLDATRARFACIEPGDYAQLLSQVDAYLSLWHVRQPASGCVLPALSAEIARAPVETRAAYECALEAVRSVLAEKVGDAAVASAVLAQCVGAVTLARGLAGDDAKRELLGAARTGARILLASLRARGGADGPP